MNPHALAERIREKGAELGFARIGFSAAGPAARSDAFRRWLARGYAGKMAYLEENPASRADVTIRSPWARTVVSAALHYGSHRNTPASDPTEEPAALAPIPEVSHRSGGLSRAVSRYAQGEDYHEIVKRQLEDLAAFVRRESGGRAEARALVDTSAILERDHAAAAGIGWTGKNAMIIDPEAGSWFFLGEILTDVELPAGHDMEDLCGSCSRCIDACPTGAIVEPRVVDARRCISYLTIELRGAIPAPLRENMGGRLFGCDVCQEVCPWNHRSTPAADPSLETGPGLRDLTLTEAVGLDETRFAARFRRSAISRAKRSGFVRNAVIVAANTRDGEALGAARGLLEDADPSLRETAVWGLIRGGDDADRRMARRAAEKESSPKVRERMIADNQL